MSHMPTRAELDRTLQLAKAALRGAKTRAEALTMCRDKKAWMEANWHPAVAKAAVQQLRDAFAAKFKGAY